MGELIGRWVLLVEDDEDLKASITEYLKEVGFKVVHAKDGVEASYKATNQCFDVIVSDLIMPKRGGVEAIERIRSGNSINKETPIIVMSGNLDETVIEQLKGDVVKAFKKPFGLGDLVNCIKKVMPVEPNAKSA